MISIRHVLLLISHLVPVFLRGARLDPLDLKLPALLFDEVQLLPSQRQRRYVWPIPLNSPLLETSTKRWLSVWMSASPSDGQKAI